MMTMSNPTDGKTVMNTPDYTWQFDHVSVLAPPNSNALQHLTTLLGLSMGARPAFPFPGRWFYRDDLAALHVVDITDIRDIELNHIALRSDMPARELARWLDSMSLIYQVTLVPDTQIAQFFLRLSASLLIELDVPDDGIDLSIDILQSIHSLND
ncbi:hypothetical protein [Enterovibrio baiacu]|uniref:hypothetical protein n=1 Tax=Enterovibrio baiacu TaxID=2491023 RepID=UPI003D0BB211